MSRSGRQAGGSRIWEAWLRRAWTITGWQGKAAISTWHSALSPQPSALSQQCSLNAECYALLPDAKCKAVRAPCYSAYPSGLPVGRAKHYTRCSQPAMSALSKPEPSRSLQVEILDLRHFSSVDLRPLLEDEVREWARLLSWDYSGSAEMILRYVDAKILPGYAA